MCSHVLQYQRLLAALRSVPPVLEVMRKASGLAPAPRKTHFVILAPHRADLVDRANAAIAELPAPWSEMKLETSATYLGVVVGPTA